MLGRDNVGFAFDRRFETGLYVAQLHLFVPRIVATEYFTQGRRATVPFFRRVHTDYVPVVDAVGNVVDCMHHAGVCVKMLRLTLEITDKISYEKFKYRKKSILRVKMQAIVSTHELEFDRRMKTEVCIKIEAYTQGSVEYYISYK
jgi:hypothetical protein